VKIKEKEIDHVTTDETVSEIAKNAGHEKAERNSPPTIGRSAPNQKDANDHERDKGKGNEKGIIVPERAERRARVGDMDE
jgi:hypothetical protein